MSTFIRTLLTVKLRERKSLVLKGQTSKQNNKHGRHFERIKLRTTSTDAVRPILANNALKARKMIF